MAATAVTAVTTATTAVITMAATTATERTAPLRRPHPTRGRAAGPDRLTVLLLTVAAFLLVLALLASQLRPAAAPAQPRPVVVLRKIYETRVVETVPGPGAGGTSITQSQSVSSSGSAAGSAPATTRSS
jgi:hypothetical protein